MSLAGRLRDLAAEELVLCGLLREPALVGPHAPAPDDFYHHHTRAAALALVPAAHVGSPLDLRSLWLSLVSSGDDADHDDGTGPPGSGLWEYLSGLLDLDPVGCYGPVASARVKWLASRRSGVHDAYEAIRDASGGYGDFHPADDAAAVRGDSLINSLARSEEWQCPT